MFSLLFFHRTERIMYSLRIMQDYSSILEIWSAVTLEF